MPVIKLKEVSVNFPFTPYPCQEEYMTKVIECLQRKVNGVLESPTGTGKTLCLLCSTLAWREYYKDGITARKITERMGGIDVFTKKPLPSSATATDGDTTTFYSDIPKIIYASRTHSQLTQVISELKNTSYRPKISVLGSREQLCINQDVMRQESNHIKVHACRAKVSTRSCVFYNNVDEKSTDKEIMNYIMDVEDLVRTGKKHRVCPYYLSRSLKQQADIIFMPYNYLLDPKSRRAHSIELKGAVVIFDEAHNVERMCEESTSFDLTPHDLISAIEAVDRLLREQASDISKTDSAEDFNVESLNSEILVDLESSINAFDMAENNQGITKPGSFIIELFQTAHVNYETKEAVVDAMEQITGYLVGRPGVFLNTSGLQKVADIIQLVFGGEPIEGNKQPQTGSSMKEFKVHIHPDTNNFKRKQVSDVWASSSGKKQGNVLSFWCFSPGFCMQELLRQDVRSIILTSGTLSPLTSFTCEMQMLVLSALSPFPVSLENPHVINRDQIFVSIVEKGPDGIQLSTAYDRRFVPENMSSMGNTVVNLARVVPHGLLVFFPSYPVMDKTLEFWKASEGLDFSDTYGRGVVITGLPFPPRMDPRVVLKMQYLDEMCRNKMNGVTYLSGQQWYRQQASRAVNQAIGRVIRHKEDYGAIFLCDHRFKSTEARNQLPLWVRQHVKIYDGFGTMVRDVAQFFRTANKLRPVPVPKQQAERSEIQAETMSPPMESKKWFSDVSQKAKTLDSHVPSLKRRKIELEELSGQDGAARLCIQYEVEMTSKRKPVSLLDALDTARPRESEETLAGEERTTVASSSASTGKAFMMELRRSLSQENFNIVMKALQTYKTSDEIHQLVASVTTPLTQDHFTHRLMRGLYQFIRPHHKKIFDLRCVELTGKGCDYKQEHSLSRKERAALMQNEVTASRVKPTIEQLDSSQQLNQGGSHLAALQLNGGYGNAKSDEQKAQTSVEDISSCSSLLADIKQAVGAEKTNQLFSALKAYKASNNYEQMVSCVVSLLTERDEDIALLERISVLIRQQHRKQFAELLRSLTGNASVPKQDSETESSQSNQATMDEGSLEEAINGYRAQLQQVEVALSAGLGSAEQADLLKLKEDLEQLVELTESSLVSLKKCQMLAALEEDQTNQNTAPVTHETALNDEFAAFYAELSEDSEAEIKQNTEHSGDGDLNGEEEVDLGGTKVCAPYRTSWGTLEYHNAMVVCSEESEGEEARVRVLYLHPTNKSMKPCGFYLEGKCRFMENCRYSHGEVVYVSELREFLEADISNMESGSACLAKHEDGIWYPARISEIEDGFYKVKFDSLLLKEALLEADGIIPPLRQDDRSSSSSSDSEDDVELLTSQEEQPAQFKNEEFCGWEAHTRGIGSKLLLKMGYELGKGLGKTLSGRVEPVQALVLPKGGSLDICVEFTQRKTASAIAKDNPASCKKKPKKRKASASTRRNVFDFLNSKLGDTAQAAASQSGSSSVTGAEAYRGGKSTKRSLNVRLFQTTERVSQVEREIQQLTKDAAVVSRLEEKLSASRQLLEQLKAQEHSIQREQKKADTHKKMTEF
ncbi:hypothetical protein DNTS_004808 [Danionella cerebrum]|uniref:Regulator of telomere elongation helicase 1 n=1 Tax=Danionella cerebrum TaxID=2873325 RepID=A0A553R940_9TELE|nr:hypothetical protein DNTS_004808 [Danionella translucida]